MNYSTAKEKKDAFIERLTSEGRMCPFTAGSTDAAAKEQYEKTAYFSGAVFRGLEFDVLDAVRTIWPDNDNPGKIIDTLCDGIAQFECESAHVPYVLENYPYMKAVFFAEDWKNRTVYLAYSESGYPSVTVMRYIDTCDFYARDRWSIIHDPTEDSFRIKGKLYEFKEKPMWERQDYVLFDGKKQMCSDEIVPSKPYPKKRLTAPYKTIEIHYPENEVFYVPPEKPKKQKAVNISSGESEKLSGKISFSFQGLNAALLGEFEKLSGKTFVVTGDLFNFSSRDALKEIILHNGGKLSGSVSSKTTALITNFPDSGTTKIRKAQSDGIPIISEQEFIAQYLTPSDSTQE
ncbi:MAG: BRCT domain-containing protein [Clostridia bacterium]|nr:BRCT domain-containing protein [Clostridia bacterium]